MEEEHKKIFAEMAASADFDRLAPRGVREVGQMIAEYLRNVVADAGTNVDTGFGFGEFDCYVKVGGVEYSVVVKLPKVHNV